MLHRVRDHYVTLVDIFRTIISAEALEMILIETGRQFTPISFIGVEEVDYTKYESLLRPFGFAWNENASRYLAHWSEELEALVKKETSAPASLYIRTQGTPADRDAWDSVNYWYWQHWKFFRSEVKTSIVQGVTVFLSLFDTDPQVRRVFCPPKELYEGRVSNGDPDARILPSFDELIESGKIVGLKFSCGPQPSPRQDHRHHDENRLSTGGATTHTQDGC